MKSTVCLAIVLVVYLLALEREKMHKFNRGYLLFGLLLSLIIAFLPSGEVIEQVYISSPILFDEVSNVVSSEVIRASITEVDPYAWFTWERFLMVIYSIGLLVMLFKYVKNATQLITKARNRNTISYKGVKLVLLNEKSLPHTFLGNIFVNEDQYRKGEIDEKLLAHEMAHVNQRHTWDVLLVELVKAIFWFNPLLILYKRVMQLNHEFLADEAVIQQYNEVSTYQHLLVDTCQNNNQIYLASNINFLLTKKRLKMMTKQSSRKRIYMLMAGVVPMAILLVMMLGQPVIAQTKSNAVRSTSDRPADNEGFMNNYFIGGMGLSVPYSFSPNGDGLNEVLKVQRANAEVKSYLLTIYDEKGAIVFRSEDVNETWNGRIRNTNGSPQKGTYNYSLFYEDIDDLEYTKNGQVELLLEAYPITSYQIPMEENEWRDSSYANYHLLGKESTKEEIENFFSNTDQLLDLNLIKTYTEKGTEIDVYWKKGALLNENISIIDTMPLSPPPPPPAPPTKGDFKVPPPPPNAPKANGIVPPPPPPAPHAPLDFNNLDDKDLIYYLDGMKTTKKAIDKMNADDIERVDVIKQDDGNAVKVYSKKAKAINKIKASQPKKGDSSIQSSSGQMKKDDLSLEEKGVWRYKGKTIRELAEDGAEVYINGKLLFPEVAGTLCAGITYDIVLFNDCGDGAIKIELESR